jgi:hypothetical protein
MPIKSFAHYTHGAIGFPNKQTSALDPGKIGARQHEGGGPVNSIKLRKTAQTPSTFGMPISGHTFGVSVRATDACPAVTSVVREAAIAGTPGAVKADMGLAQSYFPGTPAWRPPGC